jgi:hypothetical protein
LEDARSRSLYAERAEALRDGVTDMAARNELAMETHRKDMEHVTVDRGRP